MTPQPEPNRPSASERDAVPNQLTPPEWELPPGRHEALRGHLLAEIRQSATATGTAPAPVRIRPRWTRPVLTAAVAAVAAVVTLTVLPPDSESAPAASPEAVALLEGAALAAQGQRLPDGIRDDQFVYIRSQLGYTSAKGDEVKRDPIHPREVWLSIDGTRQGLLHEPQGPGTLPLGPEKPGLPTSTHYRNLQKLPTEPKEMLRWLVKNRQGDNSKDQQTFITVGDLAHESLLPPDVAAALFRAAAMIPGVKLVETSTDAAGRKGIAVARVDDGVRQELIFDRQTKRYLGERQVAVEDLENGQKKGTVTGESAVLERTVVDALGQRKPGLGAQNPVKIPFAPGAHVPKGQQPTSKSATVPDGTESGSPAPSGNPSAPTPGPGATADGPGAPTPAPAR
ncbi:CU044_5270 family protein [Streptomyces sp. NPDC057638]|uniref:CU044_5270 family protein n=1 Tax=Streptomyces sp. NPDC057638 TaxID=3346190 RepID=UPI0036BCF44A